MKRPAISTSAAALSIAAAVAVLPGSDAGAAEPAAVSVELNRLDDQGGACRASFVIANPGPDSFAGFKLDLVIFDRGGTIARRLVADFAPLRSDKTSVKVFDIPETPCANVGSILINDVVDCRDGNGPATDCVGRLALSSKLPVPLRK